MVNSTNYKEIQSLLITHQARLRCYLNKFKEMGSIERFMNGAILKLQREYSTVSREAIASQNDDTGRWVETVELIHNGIIDEEKPKYIYYQTDNTPNVEMKEPVQVKDSNGNVRYQIIALPSLERDLSPQETINHDKNKTYTFYMIRHGQAEHNIKKNWGATKQILRTDSNKDTPLTQDGISQANATGKALLGYFFKQRQQELQEKIDEMKHNNNNNTMSMPMNNQLSNKQNKIQQGLYKNQQVVQQGRLEHVEMELHGLTPNDDGTYQEQEFNCNFDKIFVSDMKRTRQTLANILNGMVQANPSVILGSVQNGNTINVNVLPCSHELAFVKGKNCDDNQSAPAVENEMKCKMCNQTICTQDNCQSIKLNNGTIVDFNWNAYVKFYGDGTRQRRLSKTLSSPVKSAQKQSCRNTDMITLAVSDFIESKTVGGGRKGGTKTVKISMPMPFNTKITKGNIRVSTGYPLQNPNWKMGDKPIIIHSAKKTAKKGGRKIVVRKRGSKKYAKKSRKHTKKSRKHAKKTRKH